MTEVFPAWQIAEMAVLIEETGADFYVKLADAVEDAELKSFFGYLAQQESEHAKIFSDLVKEARRSEDLTVYPTDFYHYVRGIAEDLRLSAFGLDARSLAKGDIIKNLDAAIHVEAKSIEAYTRIYHTLDKRITAVLPRIISEERKHLKDLTLRKKEKEEQ